MVYKYIILFLTLLTSCTSAPIKSDPCKDGVFLKKYYDSFALIEPLIREFEHDKYVKIKEELYSEMCSLYRDGKLD